MPVAELTPKAETASSKSAEVVVAVRGLTKVFKDFWNRPKARAVDNVDFEVRRGEVFGLLGPNGSGKSTTVKMLLGLLNPTRGHIQVFGHSPHHVRTKQRIGYLTEESYLYRYLNSYETLDFFGNLFRLPGEERKRRAGGREGEDAGDVVMPAVIRIDKGNQQNYGDNEQTPTGAHGEALRHGAVDESRGKNGDESGPAGLAEDFYGLGGHAIRFVSARAG